MEVFVVFCKGKKEGKFWCFWLSKTEANWKEKLWNPFIISDDERALKLFFKVFLDNRWIINESFADKVLNLNEGKVAGNLVKNVWSNSSKLIDYQFKSVIYKVIWRRFN